jgi:hypothetical protein
MSSTSGVQDSSAATDRDSKRESSTCNAIIVPGRSHSDAPTRLECTMSDEALVGAGPLVDKDFI